VATQEAWDPGRAFPIDFDHPSARKVWPRRELRDYRWLIQAGNLDASE
jgi:hypothetical protein